MDARPVAARDVRHRGVVERNYVDRTRGRPEALEAAEERGQGTQSGARSTPRRARGRRGCRARILEAVRVSQG